MLDTTTHSTVLDPSSWKDAISPGDIVSFRFPTADPDTADTPKRRPCLVLDVVLIDDERHVVLAYGTTSKSTANRGYETRVRSKDDLAVAGLHAATRFVGARRIRVPLSHRGFVISSVTGAPVLGRLSVACRERMHLVRARLYARDDMAAERRQGHSEPGRRTPRLYRMERRSLKRNPRLEVRS